MPTQTTPRRIRESRASTYVNLRTGATINYGTQSDSEVVRGEDVLTRNTDPNWRVKIATGADASNSYTRKEYKVIRAAVSRSTGHQTTATVDRTCKCQIVRAPGVADTWVGEKTEFRDMALSRLKRKLQSHYGNVNLMTPAAELKDLRGTLRNTLSFTEDFVRHLLSLKRKNRKSTPRRAGDAWLNFNFGVLPLLKDTASASKAVQDWMARDDHSFRITGVAGTDWLSYFNELSYTGLLTATLNTNVPMKHTLSYKYTGGFDIHVKSSNDYGVLQHLGFTFKNIVPTAWELVPYSWVMDYFTTAGDYFSDTFELPPGDLKYLVLNRRYTCNGLINPRFVPSLNVGSFMDSASYRNGKFEYFEFSRTVLSTLPRQTLRFKTFDEVGHYATKKLLNLVSLLPRR